MPRSMTYTVDCDVCGATIDVEVRCTSRGRNPSFMNPGEGPEFDWTTPESCPECGQTFSTDHQAVLSTTIEEKVYNEDEDWWNEAEEPDYEPEEED